MWWLVVLFLSLCDCLKTFHSPKMCDKKESYCSFQIPHSSERSCIIYNSTVCRNFDFSDWILSSSRNLTSESDAPFSVSVLPFACNKFHNFSSKKPSSAINITLTVLQEDVSGFEIFLYDDSSTYNLCRIFDFRNLDRHLKVPVEFFYDCIYHLAEYNYKNVTLTFRAFPMNVVLSYYVSIPHPEEYLSSECKWKPLFMIFSGSLLKHIVQVKFSQMLYNRNVSKYTVKLLSYPSNEQKQMVDVTASHTDELLSAEFVSIVEGYYYISLSTVTEKGILCDAINSKEFYVGYSAGDKVVFFYSYFMFLVGFIIIAVILLYYCLFNPGFISSKPHVLLAYSYDCKEHECLIKAFQAYLEKYCYVIVDTIFGQSAIGPNNWIKEKYKESEVVIFVISEGLYHTLERKNIPPLKEGHQWENQLSVAELYISSEMLNSQNPHKSKKYCTVAFPYSGKHHVPKCFKGGAWRFFAIPDEMNDLLCFIFHTTLKIHCASILPKMPGHNLESTEDGRELMTKVCGMKKLIENNAHIKYRKQKTFLEENILNNSVVFDVHNLKRNNYKSNEYENSGSFTSLLNGNPSEKVNQTEENKVLLNQESSGLSLSQIDKESRILVRQELQS